MSVFQRNMILDKLIETQAKLSSETDPKKIEELKEKLKRLEKVYKLTQIVCY